MQYITLNRGGRGEGSLVLKFCNHVVLHRPLYDAGVYILVENGYLFPPPPLGNIYFFPLKQRDFRATLPTTK
jgi:hypothetical protein